MVVLETPSFLDATEILLVSEKVDLINIHFSLLIFVSLQQSQA